MSALAGFIDFSRVPPAENLCRQMLAAQAIYGSAAPKIRALDAAEFGVDLRKCVPEDAFDAQPLVVAGALIVADVRLDNRAELIAELSEDEELADSAVLALAWARWGSSCVERLCGEFAIAVYDGARHELTLARDATGQRPLHYACRSSRVAFASMPSGILALPDGWQGFDEDSLSRVLLDIPCQPTATCFHGIHRVRPGEIVTFSTDRKTSRQSWRPDFRELRLKTDTDYADAFRDVLDTAVRSRMRRIAQPLAAHLSAGLDSSAVAATAARLLGRDEQLIALTAAPEGGLAVDSPRGRFPDESGLAALTAAKHGMNHVVVRHAEPLVERIRAQVRFCQDPFGNLINSGWLRSLELEAQAHGAGVLLCGDLGNLTLNSGGLGVLGDIARQRGLSAWWKEAWLTARHGEARWTGILFNSFGHRLPLAVQDLLIRRFRQIGSRSRLSLINSEFRAARPSRHSLALGSRTADSYRRRWEYLAALDFGNFRKGALAESGIDTRDPLADQRILRFSTTLPRDQLLLGGIPRPLAKAALADRVPGDVLHARTRGYQAADWARQIDVAGLRELVEEMSASDAVRRMIDIPRLNQLLDSWSAGPDERFSSYEMFAGHVPQAIAVGIFIREYER